MRLVRMVDISNVSPADLELGERRVAVMRSLVAQRQCSHASIAEAAKMLDVSERYVYHLFRKYIVSGGLLISQIPQKSNGGKGKSRLSQRQGGVIYEVVDEQSFLSPERLKPSNIIKEVQKRCIEKNIKCPSSMTIRRRLYTILNIQC